MADNSALIHGLTDPVTHATLTRGEAIALMITDLEAIREGAIQAVAMFTEDEDAEPLTTAALALSAHLVHYTAALGTIVREHDRAMAVIDRVMATSAVPDTLEDLTD